MFNDEEGKSFEDNESRMIFFCKGVIETVKKFGWPPNLIHCHGWMTSLIPIYLKEAYKNEPLFEDTKVIYSAYNNAQIESSFTKDFLEKALIQNLEEEDLAIFTNPEGNLDLNLGAISSADASIAAGKELDEASLRSIENSEKSKLVVNLEEENVLPQYMDFFNEV